MEYASPKHILVAVDGSANSRRAVEHVAEILSGAEGWRFTLLHVIAEPDPDYFENNSDRRVKWIDEQLAEAKKYLEEYLCILSAAGIPDSRIGLDVLEKSCPSIAQCILEEGERLGADVLALGRQGRGAREELLMGSVSKRVVHNSKGKAIWVVT